jgi:hypothetical protein
VNYRHLIFLPLELQDRRFFQGIILKESRNSMAALIAGTIQMVFGGAAG